jgi:hypothetical protein
MPLLPGGTGHEGVGSFITKEAMTMKKYAFAIAFLATAFPLAPLACGGAAEPAPSRAVDSESKVQAVSPLPVATVDVSSTGSTTTGWDTLGWDVLGCGGLTLCSSGCVCTKTDSHNCGGCDNDCNPFGGAAFVCVNGSCETPEASECGMCLMLYSGDASSCPMCSKCTWN